MSSPGRELKICKTILDSRSKVRFRRIRQRGVVHYIAVANSLHLFYTRQHVAIRNHWIMVFVRFKFWGEHNFLLGPTAHILFGSIRIGITFWAGMLWLFISPSKRRKITREVLIESFLFSTV